MQKILQSAWLLLQIQSERCVRFLQGERNFYVVITLGVIFLLLAATLTKNFVSYPIILFGAITALFAYQSYKFSKEKFRLDLRDKRLPSFNAMKRFTSVFLDGAGVHLLPEEGLMPMDEWYYRINTQVIEQASAQIERLKKKEKEDDSPLIEDIWVLYGADVKGILQDIQAALFRLEHSWPKFPSAHLEKNEIKEINLQLKKLSECGHALAKTLIKYMEFGEYSK